MTTKIKAWVVTVLTAGLLLVANARQNEPPKPPAADDESLNDAPQKQYPLISLETQEAMMRRVEEMRRKKRDPKLREKTPPADWIQFAYHGLLLDANLDVIELTPDTISKIQESIFSTLQKSALGEPLKKRGRELETLFKDQSLRGEEKLAARKAALETLLNESDETTRLRYAWRAKLLRRDSNPLRRRLQPAISSTLTERLKAARISPAILAPGPGAEYLQACRDQGVPIPPDWPDSRWVSQGRLAFVFISGGLQAEVFAYKDPAVPGVCYALPRSTPGTSSIQLLGIICQSATTGYACFWDNKESDGVTPITGPDIRLRIDSIGNGRTLAENCTMCHRGDNVFNIHPGTALDLQRTGAPGGPYETDSAIRYTPLGQTEWINPPPLIMPPQPTGQSSCTTCHTLPQTAPPPGIPGNPYCTFVLENAARLTMPPFGATRANWPPVPPPLHPRYEAHINFLAGCP